jgi:predicted nuclease of restriction endonuclease-like (RecB) superfamily
MKLTSKFYDEIKNLIHSARMTVARGVDLVQVHTNFEIGRRIVEQEQKGKNRAEYGQEVLAALSKRLESEFGRGYSVSNLEYMRKFFLTFESRASISQSLSGKLNVAAIPQTASGEFTFPAKLEVHCSKGAQSFKLSWSHYVFLLGIKNPEERSFYEIESTAQDWTVRELKRQFDSSLYERLALSRDKEGIRKLAQEGQIIAQPSDLLKEPLVLEFLGPHALRM